MEREVGATYRHGKSSKRAGGNEGLRGGGGELLLGIDAREIFARGRRRLTVGPTVSVKERERGRVDTGSGFEKMGRGLVLAVGWKCSPGPLTLFPFSFSISFLFSYSFYNFCKFGSNCFKSICKFF
jgi:hypothetical protein